MKEIWKDIVGYEGLYKISNLGRIKSLKRKYSKKDRIRKQATSQKGYKICALSKNGKLKTFIVHRLIAKEFISNPKNKPQINHINGIKTDNKIENLEWCTNSENQLEAFRLGLSNRQGENHTQNKLKNNDIYSIRHLYSDNHSLTKIAKLYKTSKENVYNIVNFKTWKHLV